MVAEWSCDNETVGLGLDRRPLLLQIHGHDLKALHPLRSLCRKKGEIAVPPSRFRRPVLSVGLGIRVDTTFFRLLSLPPSPLQGRLRELLRPEGACLSSGLARETGRLL